MQTILTVLQLFLSLGLIGLVLIQHGRGADAGAAFGSGASSTVFGARGSGSFLSRATAVLAALFFLTSMALAYYAAQGGKPAGLMDGAVPAQAPAGRQVEVPAAPAQPASEVPAVPPLPGGAPAEATGGEAAQGSDIPAVPADMARPSTGAGAAPVSESLEVPAAGEPPQGPPAGQ